MDPSSSTADQSAFQPGPDSHWSQLHLRQSEWFPKLELLIFGLGLVFAFDILFNFPLGPASPYGWTTDDIDKKDSAIVILRQYAILLSISACILLMFTSACLVFQPKEPDLSLERTCWSRQSLWSFLVVILVVGFFLFDWYNFDKPGAIIMSSWGWDKMKREFTG